MILVKKKQNQCGNVWTESIFGGNVSKPANENVSRNVKLISGKKDRDTSIKVINVGR